MPSFTEIWKVRIMSQSWYKNINFVYNLSDLQAGVAPGRVLKLTTALSGNRKQRLKAS